MKLKSIARAIALSLFVAQGTRAQSGGVSTPALDSALGRAEEAAAAHDSAVSRHIVDSLLSLNLSAPLQRAEVTYWQSRYAPSSADRERVLAELIVDYPFSPRISPALYELGMLELARSDRDRAVVHLTRFLSSTETDTNRVGASLTLGRLLLERGDIARGCAVLLVGRAEIPETAIEIRNQFDFTTSRCTGVDTTTKAPAPAPRVVSRDAAPAPRRTGAFTVQVAAYDVRSQADHLATVLRGQGLEARVVGKTKPFRVRVGRFATRSEAEDASHRIDNIAKSKSFVVVAGPEDP